MPSEELPPYSHPTTPEHREIMLRALVEAWERSPHLRLGQLLYTYVLKAEKGNVFYITDKVLFDRLQQPLDSSST